MILSHGNDSGRTRVAVAEVLAAGALLLASTGVGISTAGDAVADHGDGGFMDAGSYDELTNLADDDGYQAAYSGAAGACYFPASQC